MGLSAGVSVRSPSAHWTLVKQRPTPGKTAEAGARSSSQRLPRRPEMSPRLPLFPLFVNDVTGVQASSQVAGSDCAYALTLGATPPPPQVEPAPTV